MTESILNDLGEEVSGIIAPVSLCMFLTVVLVRALNPDGATDPAIAIAQIYYKEQEGDSTGQKLEGSAINALIFVLIVAAVTFVLVLLFKYGCERFIYGYLGFAAFCIFFILTGVVALELIQLQPIPVDVVSLSFVLWNFSVVGTVTLFSWPAPVLMKQGYMVVIGVITAYKFVSIPEWTTWTVLIALALYDIVAVLTPNGPLRMLLEVAEDRDSDVPALLYEARPVGRGRQRRAEQAAAAGGIIRPAGDDLELTDQSSRSSQSQDAFSSQATDAEHAGDRAGGSRGSSEQQDEEIAAAPGNSNRQPESPSADQAEPEGPRLRDGRREESHAEAQEEGRESEPLIPHAQPSRSGGHPTDDAERGHENASADDRDEFGLPDAIKLGMGDFIFYSVLVGRAAMYDMLTVFASYLAIVAGLGATLILLALFRKALPALPISIALGVSFYFLARAVLEPFVVPLSVHLLYF